MQDFKTYNYTLTPAQLLEIAERAPETLTIIINGEYYDIKPENDLVKRLFDAMRADFSTMSQFADDEKALLEELTNASPDILSEYSETFL